MTTSVQAPADPASTAAVDALIQRQRAARRTHLWLAPAAHRPGTGVARSGLRPGARVDCPGCGGPARIVSRFTLAGSPHPVEHVKVTCVAGHRFTPPVDELTAA